MYTINFSFLDTEYGLKAEVLMENFPFIPSIGQLIELDGIPDEYDDSDEYYGIVKKVLITIHHYESDYEGFEPDEHGRTIKYNVELEGYASPIHSLVENKPDYIDTLVTKKDV
jgi:hypothetical protein